MPICYRLTQIQSPSSPLPGHIILELLTEAANKLPPFLMCSRAPHNGQLAAHLRCIEYVPFKDIILSPC